ncbi:DMT family transporter [Plantactinospora sp. BB1]|uniref:EamA family transporter n=2 Tax=unclassified Plantactinospora TaxID=2631981 RepID=UPI000D156829|nr:EamA family transporter [Plantactinospora sp. BB1]AVT35427.1 EamA family transporter [Plantactinospora sp. BB1]
MTAECPDRQAGHSASTPADGRRGSMLRGIATMIGSGTSNQVGAAVGAHAFGTLGPAGVVAVRQFVAAAVLWPAARPNLRRFTWAQWWPTLLLGLVFATMNLSLYTAIDRIGLALAVTLEFLGPLAVALAGSRTRLDLLCAAGACLGVYVLVLPGPASDYLGVGLGLLAAACWAAYILLNRLLGARLPGLEAPAAATLVSATLYLPVAAILLARGRLEGTAILYAVAAGVLSSVVPYAADLVALRTVPARLFGVFMSVHPVLAALAGIVILGQLLAPHEWAGIAVIVTVNALAVHSASTPRPRSTARHPLPSAARHPLRSAAERRRGRSAASHGVPGRAGHHDGQRHEAADEGQEMPRLDSAHGG